MSKKRRPKNDEMDWRVRVAWWAAAVLDDVEHFGRVSRETLDLGHQLVEEAPQWAKEARR